MDALRGLTWSRCSPAPSNPNSEPIIPPPTSNPGSVKDIVFQIETATASEADHSPSSSLRTPSPHSRAPTPTSSDFPRSVSPAVITRIIRAEMRTQSPLLAPSIHSSRAVPSPSLSEIAEEEDPILKAYNALDAPPCDAGEDIGLGINPRLPPSPSLTCAMESPAAYLQALLELPDTPAAGSVPTTSAMYHTVSGRIRQSFNTSVLALIQLMPDSPIGGVEATPSKRSFNVGTINTQNLSPHTGPVALEHTPQRRNRDKKQLKVANSSENSGEKTRAENWPLRPPTPTSETSVRMVTVPGSPSGKHQADNDAEYDDPRPTFPLRTAIKDLGRPTAFFDPDEEISPNSIVPTTCDFSRLDGPMSIPTIALEGHPKPSTSPGGLAPPELPTRQKSPVSLDNLDSILEPSTNADGPKAPLGVDAVHDLDVPTAPNASPGVPGILEDATGDLPSPETPLKENGKGKLKEHNEKRRNSKEKLLKGIRKSRGKLVRTPVLAVILGRQLAGPTSNALKTIGKGLPVDPLEIISSIPAGPGVKTAAPIPF